MKSKQIKPDEESTYLEVTASINEENSLKPKVNNNF